eukprot:CAMPEP_0171454070 /NCGR_PEP_ID=MMETSP0945-20130129/1512_1 /TAXON_ID=109269 /ORGANISM="Vaucheria litorea, Strain CCMP2940" /LENGTH=506 /DNA_ID=CAMNT_0011979037 /DNA_START=40 /DNA_END=1557 /DNA_ORIENTATION=+
MEETLLSDEELNDLIMKHRPIVRFHHKEIFYPCSMEFFIEHSDLLCQEGKNWVKVPLPDKHLNWNVDTVMEHFFNNPGKKLKIEPLISHWKGQNMAISGGPPLYSFARQLSKLTLAPFLRGKLGRVVELKCVFLYMYNGSSFKVPFVPYVNYFGGIGSHTGDVEHIIVRVDADNGKVLEVFYGAHSTGEGKFCPTKYLRNLVNEFDERNFEDSRTDEMVEIFQFDSNRPVVYVAQNSHASYYAPKNYRRFTAHDSVPGFADDLCSVYGKMWDPKIEVLDQKNELFPKWVKFEGKLGDSAAFKSQLFWKTHGTHPRRIKPEPNIAFHSLLEEGKVSGHFVRLGHQKVAFYGKNSNQKGPFFEMENQIQIRSYFNNSIAQIWRNLNEPELNRNPVSAEKWVGDWFVLKNEGKFGAATTDLKGWGYASFESWAKMGVFALHPEEKCDALLGTPFRTRRRWIRISCNLNLWNLIDKVSKYLGTDVRVVGLAASLLNDSGEGASFDSLCQK